MNDNEKLINHFYQSFSERDYQSMQDCYAGHATFSDEVFQNLDSAQVKAMWEMLCRNAKDFSLIYSDIEVLDDEYATCRWIATYTFSRTGKKVANHVKAFMKIKDGKIIEHSDAFRLSTWIAQAFGWKGIMFGWMNFMKRAVQKQARKNLDAFIQKKI